jgi:hypothetical protein
LTVSPRRNGDATAVAEAMKNQCSTVESRKVIKKAPTEHRAISMRTKLLAPSICNPWQTKLAQINAVTARTVEELQTSMRAIIHSIRANVAIYCDHR